MRRIRKIFRKSYLMVFHTDAIMRGRIPRQKYERRYPMAEIFNSIGREEEKPDHMYICGCIGIALAFLFILTSLFFR